MKFKISKNNIIKSLSIVVPLVGMCLGFLYIQNKEKMNFKDDVSQLDSELDQIQGIEQGNDFRSISDTGNHKNPNSKIDDDIIKEAIYIIEQAYEQENSLVIEWAKDFLYKKSIQTMTANDSTSIKSNNILYHEVREGETLYSIAKKYNLTESKIKDFNNLNSNLIKPGQKIKILQ